MDTKQEEENDAVYSVEVKQLDLSFKDLITLEGLEDEMNYIFSEMKPKLVKGNKLATEIVKLNNNTLKSVDGLDVHLTKYILYPQNMTWIDLSFNHLTNIDSVFSKFINLRILYLHGNKINQLEEITTLKSLKRLIKLTLHGNNIDMEHNYRQIVLSTCTGLKTFDFSDITKEDRMQVAMYRKTCGKRTKKSSSWFNCHHCCLNQNTCAFNSYFAITIWQSFLFFVIAFDLTL